ncbi:hypothetical protein [Haloarchaeobius sp. DFWS5]|uniref:hypothetical protein n=1 Tax=Haloarchaeobius sp. DFWS5 TaxID=3446114 RepID=UPI003EBC2C3A
MTEVTTAEQLRTLHDHLQATESLPVERTANRWLGEAEAVAGDLVGADLPESVVRERVGHVVELLSHVDDTGSEAADEHVLEAKRLADEVLVKLAD